jgi:hypothetical protein
MNISFYILFNFVSRFFLWLSATQVNTLPNHRPVTASTCTALKTWNVRPYIQILSKK